MSADLHIHTTASDGIYSPEAVMRQAFKAGINYIAITDHDTVDGLSAIQQSKQTEKKYVHIIPGIEFSTNFPEYEVHILGYNIDIFHPDLCNQLQIMIEARYERVKAMLEKIRELGYLLSLEEISALAGSGVAIGRPHIARALIERGYFATLSDAFAALLDRQAPAYVPHYKMSPEQVIALIKRLGGISVLAHPGLIGSEAAVITIIQKGIQGLEVYYPRHTKEQTGRFAALAREYDLMVTGGSDFHGNPGRYPETLGIFTIPNELAQQLCPNT